MIWILIGVITVSIAIYAMVSISASEMNKNKKMTWFAIAALIPLVGPICYFTIRPE